MRLIYLLAFMGFAAPAHADVPRVATDIAPVHGLVSRVMQGVGAPDLIVAPGASPHGYAMRPSEARALSSADLVVWVGPELSPWFAGSIASLAPEAQVLRLSEVAGTMQLRYREDARFAPHDHDHHSGDNHEAEGHAHGSKKDHGHDHEHGHDDAHGHADAHDHDDAVHDDEEHAEGPAIDGHMWLDPSNAALWLDTIATRLATLDPSNAAVYAANAAEAMAELDKLSTDLKEQVSALGGRPFVVFHDSYHYFERYFGLSAVASITLGDAGTASAARLSEVRDIITETGATCALAEPRANAGLIDAVAQDSGIRTTTLDAVGIGIPLGPDYFDTLLRQIAQGLTDCLSGA